MVENFRFGLIIGLGLGLPAGLIPWLYRLIMKLYNAFVGR